MKLSYYIDTGYWKYGSQSHEISNLNDIKFVKYDLVHDPPDGILSYIKNL